MSVEMDAARFTLRNRALIDRAGREVDATTHALVAAVPDDEPTLGRSLVRLELLSRAFSHQFRDWARREGRLQRTQREGGAEQRRRRERPREQLRQSKQLERHFRRGRCEIRFASLGLRSSPFLSRSVLRLCTASRRRFAPSSLIPGCYTDFALCSICNRFPRSSCTVARSAIPLLDFSVEFSGDSGRTRNPVAQGSLECSGRCAREPAIRLR